jgi:hypothetical protein
MEPSIIKGKRFSNAEDTKYKINPALEIENLRTIINQLQDKLSQCNLECDTEKVAKRAAQRELASVKVLLKNIQEEQCFRWTQSDKLETNRYDITSTNPFELDFDENELLELSGGTVTTVLNETDKSINGLESIMSRVSLDFQRLSQKFVRSLTCFFFTSCLSHSWFLNGKNLSLDCISPLARTQVKIGI